MQDLLFTARCTFRTRNQFVDFDFTQAKDTSTSGPLYGAHLTGKRHIRTWRESPSTNRVESRTFAEFIERK